VSLKVMRTSYESLYVALTLSREYYNIHESCWS